MVKRSREDFDTLPTSEYQDLPTSTSGHSSSSRLPVSAAGAAAESSKLLQIDTDSGEGITTTEVMRCSLPPHARQTISFTSFEDYETHYNKTHVNRCAECRKNFPTPHFLDLHISENHNPLVEVLKDRGERTYSCFVEDCDRKCSTAQKRRMHLIDKHMFPKEYDFYIVNDGIDQRTSMLRSGRHRRRSSAAQHKTEIEDRTRRRGSTLSKPNGDDSIQGASENLREALETDAPDTDNTANINDLQPDAEMEGLTVAMSALKFVPSSVRFGRGKGKGGFSKC